MAKSLFQLTKGHTGTIKEILTDSVTRERLESLGFIEGAEILTVRGSPLGCPRIYKTLNTLVAIRNDIAKQVLLEETT